MRSERPCGERFLGASRLPGSATCSWLELIYLPKQPNLPTAFECLRGTSSRRGSILGGQVESDSLSRPHSNFPTWFIVCTEGKEEQVRAWQM